MSLQELLGRLSVAYDAVTGGTGYHVVLLDGDGDGGTQIGLEDDPGTMAMDFSDEALLENAELDGADARLLQEHAGEVVRWVSSRGYKVVVDE